MFVTLLLGSEGKEEMGRRLGTTHKASLFAFTTMIAFQLSHVALVSAHFIISASHLYTKYTGHRTIPHRFSLLVLPSILLLNHTPSQLLNHTHTQSNRTHSV